jgi:hypothetical protein
VVFSVFGDGQVFFNCKPELGWRNYLKVHYPRRGLKGRDRVSGRVESARTFMPEGAEFSVVTPNRVYVGDITYKQSGCLILLGSTVFVGRSGRD